MNRLSTNGALAPAAVRRRAGFRLALGFAQMASAGFALALIIQTGLSFFAMAAFAFTTALTLTSLLLFRGRRR